MNTKSLTLVAAIIVIAGLIVVPSIRDQSIDDRFDGEAFPPIRPEHAFQSAELQPAVGLSMSPPAENPNSIEPAGPIVSVVPNELQPKFEAAEPVGPAFLDSASESDATFDFGLSEMTNSETSSADELQDSVDNDNLELELDVMQASPIATRRAAEFGLAFSEQNGQLQVVSVESERAAGAYGVLPNDILLMLDDAKLTSKIDFDRVASQKLSGDSANMLLLRGDQVVAIEAMRLGGADETMSRPIASSTTIGPVASLSTENRNALLGNPFESPIAATPAQEVREQQAPADEQFKLARIYSGDVAYQRKSNEPRLAFNPYASSQQGDTNTRKPQRPVAIPRFDQTPTSILQDETGTKESASSELGLTESTTSGESRPVSLTGTDAEATPEPLPVNPGSQLAEALPKAGEPTLAEAPETMPTPSDVKYPVPTSVQSIDAATEGSLPAPEATPDPAPSLPPTPVSTESPSMKAMPYPAPTFEALPPASAPKAHPAGASYTVVRHPSPMQVLQGEGGTGVCTSCQNSQVTHDWSYCNNEPAISVGGWLSAGYHSASNDLFNSRPDNFALHQGWLFAERKASESSPLGFRVDALYGIDAQDTQAFGNNAGTFDFMNGFDHGSYGWALPQAYVELALGEWNVRAGHFFTLIGYETVAAQDNFFYSHAMTMYNSEPFTHTGVLVNRTFGDFDVFAGWSLGWDTGFDQFGDGGSWLGGVSYEINEDASLAYFSTAGNFGKRGDDGYSHSVVLDLTLTENWNYVLQSDYLRVDSTGEDNVGLNAYSIYTLTDKVSLGSRVEWWKGDVLTGYAPHGAVLPAAGSLSYFATTFGLNVQPTESLVLRPEVRHDWSPAANYDETYFAVDAVWSF